MKKILLLSLLVPFLLLSACNGDSSVKGNDETNNKTEEDKPKNDTDTSKSSVDEYKYGEFDVAKVAKNIGSYKTGPISLTVEEAQLVSGTFEDEYYTDHFGKKDVQYLQLAMVMSTDDQNINFNSKHLTLTTNTGEKIGSPSDFMGTKVDPQYLSKDGTTRILFYFFEDSDVKDIHTIDLHLKSPTNKKGEPLGEDIDIKMNFTEKEDQ
ncbi:hypothetical protein [Halobacillus litoralis]|uniref:DUF4352 domain-containing protein n=1 Tax=Halobacillus litoralis TaxID=45668 RepID=A0A410MJH5_9BACI|nr:hypothetical protein [Halobacillus litoralis]QAS54850.1 hypothetical protein HLI_21605 [Halobacillus litoralis]